MTVSVEIFPWNVNFETGLPAIDDQHRRLVALLNTLAGHLAHGSDAPTLTAVFGQLAEYAAVHFAAEEVIWRTHFADDQWAKAHASTHASFVGKVEEIRQAEANRPLEEAIERIVKFLTHWLAFHILDTDKRCATAVRALSTGIPLERAKGVADEAMSGAAQVLIDTIMAMYDHLASRTIEMTREIGRRKVAEEELRLAQGRAEAASLAKSTFLANMSHELRTPLNSVLGLAEALQEDVYGPLAERQRQALTHIEESGRHLLGLINDILDLSKVEAGRLELEVAPFAVVELCQASQRLIREAALKKRLEVSLAIDPAVSVLVADERRLKQVLVNLLTNAVKFTPEGGSLGLEVTGERDRRAVRFTVWDTGIGISEADQARLFQPFVQLDSSLGRAQTGTGLGLSLVARLAALHGGSVALDSSLGQGSRFTVRIPWRTPDAPDAPPATPAAA